MNGRIKKIAFWFIFAAVLWCLIVSSSIWRFGSQDYARQSDCIIVLGAAVQGSNPSPVFAERIRHGIELYHTGYAQKLVFTGGIGEGQTHSEAAVGRGEATQQGVPFAAVLIEEQSRTTHQNLVEAATVMQKQGLKSAIIVSDPLHIWISSFFLPSLPQVSPRRASTGQGISASASDFSSRTIVPYRVGRFSIMVVSPHQTDDKQ